MFVRENDSDAFVAKFISTTFLLALTMTTPLIPPTFLFRFAAPCIKTDKLWTPKGKIEFPESHRVPSFGELENRPVFADLRMAWSEKGLAFSVKVVGKKQELWCRPTRIEDSDGINIWIDTRNTQNVHRASRFCHHFVVLPQGGFRDPHAPLAVLCEIPRARENPKRIKEDAIKARSEVKKTGYSIRAFIPAEAMTGFDTNDHRHLGFSYAVVDRELGWQTFAAGNEFPITNDPSLWGTLDLI
jgi:hypothetical protein